MRLTYLTYNSVMPNTVFQWAPQPQTTNVYAIIVAAGGGGMGSETLMSYGGGHPIPYQQYGKMGGAVCLDTDAPVMVQMDDNKITWPGHPIRQSQGLFFNTNPGTFSGLHLRRPYFAIGNNTEIYPAIYKMTPNAFYISESTYAPPGGPNFPSVPAPITGNGMILVTPFRYTIPGSMGGGIIGDQSGPQAGIFPPPPDPSIWFPGESGSCLRGAGGPGGASLFGFGAIAQQGTMAGNLGYDPGGGGSAGAMGTPSSPVTINGVQVIPYSQAEQVGGSGGAGGGTGFAALPRRNVYDYYCGEGGHGGPAGPGGWDGGRGGHSLLLFIED